MNFVTFTETQAKENTEGGIVLSLIICSRNDDYMGDPMWRLATSINFVSECIHELGRASEVEVVVADWGSEHPIAEVIQLTDKAAQLTRFVLAKPALATELQQDSVFGEVYALNLAARRSRGLYIGRIDQDTLVTSDFLQCFFDAYEGIVDYGFDLETSYMFAARKQLPYSFIEQQPGLKTLQKFIRRYAKWTFSEELNFCFWASPVGILMMHRNMWDEIGGYDERLIYYWFMDVDLATRLIKKYPIVNIGKRFGYHFFHLEHIRPGFKFRHNHRKLNPDWSKSFDKPVLNPNGRDWGLAKYKLREVKVEGALNGKALKAADEKAPKKSLLFRVILISIRRWGYYQIKYGWYLTKRLRGKPYL